MPASPRPLIVCADCAERRENEGRGLCRNCYRKRKRRGTLPPLAARPSAEERFLAKIEITPDGCWQWTGGKDRDGYGSFVPNGKGSQVKAATFAYTHFVGPISVGLQLDHVCHTRDATCPGGAECPHRGCVNPAHLEPVTPRENTLRGNTLPALNAAKTHCPKGHPYDDENTCPQNRGMGRVCRTCRRERDRRRRSVPQRVATETLDRQTAEKHGTLGDAARREEVRIRGLRCRTDVLATISSEPGQWSEQRIAATGAWDREDVASACGHLLDAGEVALLPDGTYTTALAQAA